MEKFKIAIACDHAGFELKKAIVKYLISQNFEIQDYPIDIQEKIIIQCDIYDKICSDLSDINKIVFKNIITEIEKNNINKKLITSPSIF